MKLTGHVGTTVPLAKTCRDYRNVSGNHGRKKRSKCPDCGYTFKEGQKQRSASNARMRYVAQWENLRSSFVTKAFIQPCHVVAILPCRKGLFVTPLEKSILLQICSSLLECRTMACSIQRISSAASRSRCAQSKTSIQQERSSRYSFPSPPRIDNLIIDKEIPVRRAERRILISGHALAQFMKRDHQTGDAQVYRREAPCGLGLCQTWVARDSSPCAGWRWM